MIKLGWNDEHQDLDVRILKQFKSLTREQQLDYLDAWTDYLVSIRRVISRLHLASEMKKMGIGNDATK